MKTIFFSFAAFLTLFLPIIVFPQTVKPCEFAGPYSFYPGDKDKLNAMIDELIAKADPAPVPGKITGIICPHAGYIYSAPVAAYSYKSLFGRAFDTIILLGATHRYPYSGIALYPKGEFATPLGNLAVDEGLGLKFLSLDFVKAAPQYFNNEHSLEVQLPFIAKYFPSLKIVPLLFGELDKAMLARFAQTLAAITKDKNILIIVSSDLSHYHLYDEAKAIDAKTIAQVESLDADGLYAAKEEGRACGILPLVSFLMYLKETNQKIQILNFANSGDTAGDKTRVVGYMSAAGFIPDSLHK